MKQLGQPLLQAVLNKSYRHINACVLDQEDN